MSLSTDQREVTRQLRRNRPDKPARFRRDNADDYPAGYLAQLARPLLSRKAAKARRAANRTRPASVPPQTTQRLT